MREYQSISPTKWDCKYHIVFIPERRKRVLYGKLRRELGKIFHELARQKESQIVEGHLRADHVHMCISNPAKACCGQYSRVPQREECDHGCPEFSESEEEFFGEAFLGQRLFCLDGGARRSYGTGVHQKSRERGRTVGTAHLGFGET
jgi:REP-associated tyrosine transposase